MLDLHTLSDSESPFTAIFNSSPNYMVLVGRDYRIKALNQQANEIFRLFWNYDLKVEESVLSLAKIFNLSDFEEHFHFKEALAGKLLTEERTYKDIYLREWWFEFTYIPVKTSSGEIFAVCLSFRNITRRKGIEESLLSSVATNRAFVEAMPDMLFRLNRDGVFVNYKASQDDKLLVNREDIIGRSVSEILPPYLAGKVLDYIEKTLQTGKLQILEYQLEIKGTLSFFEARLVVSAEGEVLAIVRNITERKQAENLLKRYQLLAKNSLDIILFLRPDGTLVEANQAAVLAYGYTLEELLTLNIRDLRANEALPQITDQMQQARSGGIRFETIHRCKDGTLLPVEVVSSESVELGGERVLLSVIRDITERKQAEEALRESEELYRSVVHTMSEGVVLHGSDGVILASNPSARQILGLPEEELTGRDSADLHWRAIHEDITPFPGAIHPAMLTLQTGKPYTGVVMGLEGRNNLTRWISINTEPLFQPDHTTLRGVVASFVDITQQKEMKEALQRSEELYRVLVNNLPNSVVVLFDHNLRYLVAKGTSTAHLGFSSAEVEGKTFYEVVPPAGRAGILPHYQNALAGIEESFEFQHHELVYQARTAALRNGQGEIYAGMIFTSDITTLKKTEQALRESEKRYRSVVDSIKEVVFQTDTEGHWTFLNPAWTIITGFSVEESLGEKFYDFIHPGDRTQSLKLFQPLMERKRDFCRYQARYLTKEGEFRWIEVYIRLIVDDKDNILGTSGLLRDITGRRLAEEALQDRFKFEELIASISTSFINVAAHEIDREIKQALATIGHFSGANWGYIFLFSEDGTLLSNTHEWCEEGVMPQISRLQKRSVASFPWTVDQIQRLETLYLPSLESIPLEARAERAALEIPPAQSLLIVPLIYERKAVGFLGFDLIKSRKPWGKENVALLRVVGEIFTSAIKRKITEQTLVEERDFAQMVLNTMGEGLVTTNVAGQLQFVNPAYTRILGYSSEELLGRNPAEFVHPEDVAQRNENYRRSISTTGHTYEGRMIHRDGRILNITATVVPMYRENQLKGSIGVITDITYRRQGEEALLQSEQRLRTVVSNVPMMLFAVDQKGVTTFADGRGFKELDVDSAHVIGLSIEAPFTVAHKYIIEKIHQALEGEFINTLISMKNRTYELWLSPVKEESGQVSSVIGVALDVSEKLLAEEEIRQALEKEKELSTLKSRFISMASHDFRTPLTTILSSAELLENYSHRWDDERKQKIYQRIYASVQTMTGLLEEVLFITKSEAGK
ncbi:MAG: PAS domain S-box protein, partial [Chloroflexota bacterium]